MIDKRSRLRPSFSALFAGILFFSASAFSQTLTIVSGQGQVLPPTSLNSVPLKVQLLGPTGQPLSGQAVSFTVTSPFAGVSGGYIQQTGTVITDPVTGATTPAAITGADGTASVQYVSASPMPPFSYIPATITAAYGATAVVFYETTSTIISGGGPAVSSQLLSPTPGSSAFIGGQSGSISTTPIQVQVTALFSNVTGGTGVANVALSIITDPGSVGTISCKEGNYVLTDTSGIATCTPVFGKVGAGTFTINVGNFVTYNNSAFQVTVGPPAIVQITTGNNQSGTPGVQLPLPIVGVVTDIGGNPVAGVDVSFTSVTPGAFTFTNVRSNSDSAGRVSANVVLGGIPGPAQIKVTDTLGRVTSPAIFTETVNLTITGLTKVAGDGQTAIVNAAFTQPIVAQISTAAGQPIQGIPISFAVTSGSATVTFPTTTTNAAGQSATTVTAGPTAGPVVITATSGAFSVSFNLTVAPPGPSNLTFTNGASGAINSVSPGSIITIYGSGLAAGVQGVVGTTDIGPHPYNVAGVTAIFGTVPAPIFALGNSGGSQFLTIQVPFETPVGASALTINTPGGGSATVPVSVAAASPGLFEYIAADNLKHLVALRPNGSVVSPSNPTVRGESVRFYATGLGPFTPGVGTNSFSPAGSDPTITYTLILGLNNAGVDPAPSTPIYARGLVGVEEISFIVPAAAPSGAAQISIGIQGLDGTIYYSQGSLLNVQ